MLSLSKLKEVISMTIKEIAAAAGVSPATVSKIINQKDSNISEETRARVLKIVAENDYIPYAGVRDRLLARNNLIAMLVPSLQDPFYACFAETVRAKIAIGGYMMAMYSYSGDSDSEEQLLQYLSENFIAGLIYFPSSSDAIAYLSSEECNIKNAVLLDCDNTGLAFPQWTRSFSAAAESGTVEFLKNGHKRIALLLDGKSPTRIHSALMLGYSSALSSALIGIDETLVFTSEENTETDLNILLDSGVDALLCQNDSLTSLAIRALSQKKYRIPNDVSVICLEDSAALAQFTPAISAIASSTEEMARAVVDTLTSQINTGVCTPFTRTLPFSFVNRESVKDLGKPRHKIVIAGSINMDITLNVSHLPHSGETVLSSGLSSWPGGKGANQAIGVSRFGGNAFMIGRLGNDLYGKQLYERLTSEKVDMHGVAFSKGKSSGTAYINVQSDGQSTIVVNPGANTAVDPEYIEHNRSIFADAQYCLIQMEIPLRSIEKIVEICIENDVKVILKPSPVQHLPSSILSKLFLIVPNQEELEGLVNDGKTTKDKAEILLGAGVQNVIVTLADRGCVFVSKEQTVEYPAYPYPCVDATGASDIFISCLAAQLSQGKSMNEAIKLATLAASYSVSKEGVQNSIIDSGLLYDLYNGEYSLEKL